MRTAKKALNLVLAVMLAAVMLAACAPAPDKPPAQSPAQVTDMLERNVAIGGAPDTIVSLVPSTTEILFALGAGDKIKGVDAFSNYPAETAQIEKAGDFNGPDMEKIAALKPDVVFAGYINKDTVMALEKLGITVVVTEAKNYDGIYESIALIAQVLGKKSEGDALIKSTKDKVDGVAKKAAAFTKHPSVYYVISFGEAGGNWTSGPGSFINTLFEKAGFTCATADGEAEWLEYPLEQLVQKDPDILLLASDVGQAEDLQKENGYKDLTAVKNGKVYVVDANILSRPGVRVGEAMELLYGILEKNQ